MRFKRESVTNGRLFGSVEYSLSIDRSIDRSIGSSNLIRRMFFFILFLPPFSLLDFVIYFVNVWNEREAGNPRERRDFEDDEVKSHLALSSAQPFIYDSVPLAQVIITHFIWFLTTWVMVKIQTNADFNAGPSKE